MPKASGMDAETMQNSGASIDTHASLIVCRLIWRHRKKTAWIMEQGDRASVPHMLYQARDQNLNVLKGVLHKLKTGTLT